MQVISYVSCGLTIGDIIQFRLALHSAIFCLRMSGVQMRVSFQLFLICFVLFLRQGLCRPGSPQTHDPPSSLCLLSVEITSLCYHLEVISFICLFIMYVMNATILVWRSEDKVWGSFHPSYQASLRPPSLGGKCLHLWGHLTGPVIYFLNLIFLCILVIFPKKMYYY